MIKLKPTTTNLAFLGVLGVLLIVTGPIAMIWSLNILFPSLAIPYTIETWIAAFLVPALLKSNVSINKD